MLKKFTVGITALAALFSVAANAAVRFEFTYTDPLGSGFNGTGGASLQHALEKAGAIFGGSVLGNYDGVIDIAVSSGNFAGASATSQFGGITSPAGSFGKFGVIPNKIQSNGAVDLNGGAFDGALTFGLNSNFNLDIDAATTGAQVDFYTVAFHELTHLLGFYSIAGENGQGLLRNPLGAPSDYAMFDRWLTDGQGNFVIDPDDFTNQLTAQQYDALVTGGSSADGNGLYFAGANAMAANGGQPVGLFSPSSFQPGSSVSHVDENNPLLADMLMSPVIFRGQEIRRFSAIELGMMQDIGLTEIQQLNIDVIPLPGAAVFMSTGLVALALRRRRQAAA